MIDIMVVEELDDERKTRYEETLKNPSREN